MTRVLFALLGCALLNGPARAQDKTVETADATVKFVELKYLLDDPSDRFNRVVDLVSRLVPSVRVISDPVLKTVALRGAPEGIQQVEQLLRRFDLPAKAGSPARQIQITVHLLEPAEGAASPNLPAGLTSAVEQLRAAFGHKSYRLVDTILMRGREPSGVSSEGMLPGSNSTSTILYSARYQSVSYAEEAKVVHLTGFQFNMQVPVGATNRYVGSNIQTDVAIRDGQKLVLTKLNKQEGERPLFLVLTATVEQQ